MLTLYHMIIIIYYKLYAYNILYIEILIIIICKYTITCLTSVIVYLSTNKIKKTFS